MLVNGTAAPLLVLNEQGSFPSNIGQRSQRAILIPSKLRRLWSSRVFRLALGLAVGKAVVITAVCLSDPSSNALYSLGTQWDSNYYEIIATHGYSAASAPYVFSPMYPAAIKLVYSLLGNAWVSALLVTNALSFVFPVLLYKTFDYRTALLVELFPTYLVFTTVAYSDVIALVFLGLSVLLLSRESIIKSSAALSAAIFTFFNLAWTVPSFLLPLLKEKRLKGLLFCAFPLLTGGLTLLWFKVETGGYFNFFQLESPWGVQFANPLAQAEYLLCLGGTGSFTCQPWAVQGIILTPAYWLVRNLLFEALYVIGALWILKTAVKHRVLLSAYSLSVVVPLLFLTGFPALSIPRLLLPAFPVFVGYSRLMTTRLRYWSYIVLCLGLAAPISMIQHFAIFA
jgi:hypothetical protein